LTAAAISSLYSLVFIARYLDRRASLFTIDPATSKRILVEGRMIEDFFELAEPCLAGFELVLVMLAGMVLYHYLSYYLGGKPIYTMMRLPNPWERHIRVWAAPILGAAAIVFLAAIVLGLYLALYWIATPDVCIPDGQWIRFLRIWRGV